MGAEGSLGAGLGEGTQGQTQPGIIRQGHGDGDDSLRQGGLRWDWRPCSLNRASPGTPVWVCPPQLLPMGLCGPGQIRDTRVLAYKYRYSCKSQRYFEDPNCVLDPVE